MKPHALPKPLQTSFLIGGLVFLLVSAVWQLGWLQTPELWVYDYFVKARVNLNPHATDPRLVLVLQDEKDIEALDYPLRDKVLSEVLEKIESGGPVVVGLDIYRDLPVPRDGSESTFLTQTLRRYPNIITIFLYGTEDHPFLVPPPPSVSQDPTRYGFNDFPYDYTTVRRGFLLMPWDKKYNPYQSFALTLAYNYLAPLNVPFSQIDDNDIQIGKTTFRRFEGHDGGYIGAPDGGFQFMLDYRGPKTFTTKSILEVLNLKKTDLFKDKIVLLGISAGSSNDNHGTPLGDREAGTAIHAQIINQLLRAALEGDRPVIAFGESVKWLLLTGGCLSGVLSGLYIRSYVIFALATVLAVAAIVLIAWLCFLAGRWIPVILFATAFLPTSMLVKAYAANHEEHQRESLMRLFSQRVSPAIAEEIWKQRNLFLQGGRPAAQRLVVTALFTDLKNYSTISEKMSPDELIAWVNECQGALAQHVDKNGGIVTCYMGDGMMAVFGIPVARTNEADIAVDAVNAVQCAISMSGEIRQMNARWQAEGKPLAGLRVGIYTGEAMVGVLGNENHLEYSIIGDTVNTASRLESVDKEGTMTGDSGDCRILIGARTFGYVKESFTAKHVGTINLKGKLETTEVYRVIC